MKKLAGVFFFSILFSCTAFAQQQIEIVFDASNSMNDPMAGGTRLSEAKNALAQLAEQIAPDALVGLRVFGKTPVTGNVRESCFDSKLLFPIQPFNKQAMLSEVAQFTAYGQTALGYSLELAGQDFSPAPEIKKTIILISDGEESCGKDPINVIGAFKARGINFVVHAIGLAVDPKTKAQLNQITQMTGGTYQDAGNAVELKKSLQTVAATENIATPAAQAEIMASQTETPEPKLPAQKLLQASRETSSENLLAASAGAKIVSASNEDLAEAIDGVEDSATYFSEGDTAVFSFKDNQTVLIEKFAMPIAEENGQNAGEISLSGSIESATSDFFPITKIHPKNQVDFKNINQEFVIVPPVAVKYLRVRVGKSVEGGSSSLNNEWKIYGKYLSESEAAATLKDKKEVERNLLSKEAGGRLIASSDPSFAHFMDGNSDAPGESAFIQNGQEAVFGFKNDQTALLSDVAIPIFETSQYNCKEFEFSVSETSPSEGFTSVGTFKTQNLVLAESAYQKFKFTEPLRAKYLKMKLLAGHENDDCELAEIQANGVFTSASSSAVSVAPQDKPAPIQAKLEKPVESAVVSEDVPTEEKQEVMEPDEANLPPLKAS